jgi:hypothetical protein
LAKPQRCIYGQGRNCVLSKCGGFQQSVQKNKAFLGIRREKSGLHVSMASIETWPSLSLHNDYLCFATCSLSLLLHFDDCEFINPLPLSFVYIYLIYRQDRAFSSGLVYIPHMYKTFLYPAHCFCHCSVLLSHHCSTIFVNIILPVTLGTLWRDLPLPISSDFAHHSMQLPAACQQHVGPLPSFFGSVCPVPGNFTC